MVNTSTNKPIQSASPLGVSNEQMLDLHTKAQAAAQNPPSSNMFSRSGDVFGGPANKSQLASLNSNLAAGRGNSKVGDVIEKMMTSGEAINPGEANCGYTVMEILKRSYGDTMGVTPSVPETVKNLRSNGKWQEISLTGYTPKAGDVAISENYGHMGANNGKMFVASNESNIKTVRKSHYQVENGNINTIFRPIQNGIQLNDTSTIS